MNARIAVVLLLIAFTVSGCFLFGRGGKDTEPPDFISGTGTRGASATLGIGDVFEVRVFGDADLSGVYRVSSDGMINFPLVGKVKADGL